MRPIVLVCNVLGVTLLTLGNYRMATDSVDISPISEISRNSPGLFVPIPKASPISATMIAANSREALIRPLFVPSRRPFRPPPRSDLQPKPASPSPASNKQSHDAAGGGGTGLAKPSLIGISLSAAGGKALLKAANHLPEWVPVGGEMMGWKVQSVGQSSARIVRDDDHAILRLYPDLLTAPGVENDGRNP